MCHFISSVNRHKKEKNSSVFNVEGFIIIPITGKTSSYSQDTDTSGIDVCSGSVYTAA